MQGEARLRGREEDCGLKPSLRTWKPLRGLGVESWVRGRPRPHAETAG